MCGVSAAFSAFHPMEDLQRGGFRQLLADNAMRSRQFAGVQSPGASSPSSREIGRCTPKHTRAKRTRLNKSLPKDLRIPVRWDKRTVYLECYEIQ
jgi:hypothetical protein